MPGQRIDWRRARHPKYDETPLHEISYKDAQDDREILMEREIAVRKARAAAYKKLPRSLKERRKRAAIEKAKSRPDGPDELCLSTILNSQQLKHYGFQRQPFFPLTDRSFVCEQLKVRILIDRKATTRTATIRPGRRDNFRWVSITVSSDGLKDEPGAVACWVEEVCKEQKILCAEFNE